MKDLVDVNYLLTQIAEGKLSVEQINYVLNTAARYTERVDANDETQQH